MANFIEDLDELYKMSRTEHKIAAQNKNFYLFVPVKVSLYEDENTNYLIRKGEFTKFLYIRNNCRVYFSDADILEMLLQIEDKRTIDLLIKYLAKVYRGEAEKFYIFVGEKQYEVMGIPEIRDAQILMNPKDIDIAFEELLVLINLILAKDIAAVPLWADTKPNFFKHTCAKYISLLKFYYYGDINAEQYLESIGYDTNEDIYSNYGNETDRDEKHNLFYDFNLFEMSGVV